MQGGVVIDMSALDGIDAVEAGSVWVDAGVRWRHVLEATLPLGKSPPTLTDYIELSVGGTLSAGGIGGQAYRHGLQVDNVLELEVVTGEGHLVRCSASSPSPWKKALFDAARAGLGQFGIVVRARLRLIDVPAMARVYTAFYEDIHVFAADQLLLADDGRFDYLEGFAEAADSGEWHYKLEVTRYFDPQDPPDDAAMLAGLSFTPGTEAAADSTLFDFLNRLAPVEALLRSIGIWYFPHPWIDMFLPGPTAASFAEAVLAATPPSAVNGPVIFYPFKRSALTAPFLQVPATDDLFLFSLLRTAIPPLPPVAAALVQDNNAALASAVALGGKRYPIGAVDQTQADWIAHYGAQWPAFAAAKQAFDPNGVLTPGHGIF